MRYSRLIITQVQARKDFTDLSIIFVNCKIMYIQVPTRIYTSTSIPENFMHYLHLIITLVQVKVDFSTLIS